MVPRGQKKKWYNRYLFSLFEKVGVLFSALPFDYDWPGVIILAVLKGFSDFLSARPEKWTFLTDVQEFS